jgi:hypothetical protein
MKTFNFWANGVDFGEWIASTQAQAQDAFAMDAGYKSWADMCQRVDEFGGNTVEVLEQTA